MEHLLYEQSWRTQRQIANWEGQKYLILVSILARIAYVAWDVQYMIAAASALASNANFCTFTQGLSCSIHVD
jgi:hypothetical protein